MRIDALQQQLVPGGAWSAFGAGDGAWWDSVDVPFALSKDDFLVTVSAGMILGELQSRLAAEGLVLPYAPFRSADSVRIGALLGANLPHRLEQEFRSWRDWVLGATMLLTDGTLAKSGARVTKSVAGFDAHQLPIGTLGTLVVPVQVHLRVVAAVRVTWPEPIEMPSPAWFRCDDHGVAVVDTPPTVEGSDAWWMDENGIGSYDPLQIQFWQRAKAIFDPDDRLAPLPEGVKT